MAIRYENRHDVEFVDSIGINPQEQERSNLKSCIEAIDTYVVDTTENPNNFLEAAVTNIAAISPEALPNLVSELREKDSRFHTYEMGVWIYTLAQPENLDLVVDIATSADLYINQETETLTNVFNTMQNCIVAIREYNPSDSRLNLAAKKVIEVIELGFDSEFDPNTLLTTLAMTGTQEAQQYIESMKGLIPRQQSTRYENMLFDVGEAKFNTVGHSKPNSHEIAQMLIHGYENSRSKSQKYERIDWASLSAEYKETCIQVEDILQKIESDLEPEVISIVKLGIFNFLRNNPHAQTEALENHLFKYLYLSKKEAEAKQVDNPLPTIGIEVECPSRTLTDKKVEVLDRFKINNGMEQQNLWEVKPTFNYSWLPQARIMQELVNMKAIPLGKETQTDLSNESIEVKVIPENEMISLHINLGLPEGINLTTKEIEDRYQREIDTFADILIYGYVSPSRIRKRKVPYGGVMLKDNTEDAKESLKSNRESQGVIRLELRPTEFRDFSNYRLLNEAQNLGGMLFAHIKKSEGATLSDKEAALATLWDEFTSDAKTLEKKYIPVSRLYDKDKETAASIIEVTSVRNESRKVSHKYSQKVGEIIEK